MPEDIPVKSQDEILKYERECGDRKDKNIRRLFHRSHCLVGLHKEDNPILGIKVSISTCSLTGYNDSLPFHSSK